MTAPTSGTAQVLVVTEANSAGVIANYAWAMASIDCRGLLIPAETDTDRAFYLRLIPGLRAVPRRPTPPDPAHEGYRPHSPHEITTETVQF